MERGQELAHGPAHRYRVTGGLDTAEGEHSFLVAEEPAPEIPLGLLGVLVLVEAVRRRMPDVVFRARDRVSVGVDDPARENSGGPSVGERTIDSPLFIRATSVDRPSEPAISLASLWLGVVKPAEPRHDVEDGVEFPLGQPHFAGEIMQVPHQRLDDLLDARVVGPLRLGVYHRGKLVFVLVDHVSVSS